MKRWWLQAAVSLVVAALLLSVVPIERVWQSLRSVNLWVWAASVAVFLCGHALNAIKLRLLLAAAPVSSVQCIRAHFAGMAANLGLPGVAGGELVRAAYLVRQVGAARVTVASVADRVVDTIVILLILVTSTARAGYPEAVEVPLPGPGWLLPAAAGVLIAVLLLWLMRGSRILRALGEASHALLRRPGVMLLALAISLGVQWMFVLTIAWLGREVGVSAPMAPWFLAWTLSRLSAILPISLGGLGVREAALVSVLSAYGAASDAVLATGLLWDGVIVVGSLGGFLVARALPDGAHVRDGTNAA